MRGWRIAARMGRALAGRAWAGAALAGTALSVGAPAHAEVLRIDGVFAATAREASLLPTIAVDRIDGPDGGALADAIEQRLAKLGADGLPHPQLITPGLRPDGLLSGAAGADVSEQDYAETRQRCVEKDKDGKCTRREKYRVQCVRRTIAFRADLRLARRSDGRVLYAVPKTRADDASWCEDGGSPLSVAATLQGMIDSVALEVRFDVAPHREQYKIRVQESRDGLPRDAAALFRQAVRLTKSDQQAACRTFAQVDQAVPDHGPTMFNLALCAEAAGLYAEAGDRYTRTRLLWPKAGGDVSKGLARIGALAAGEEDVRRMAALALPSPPRGGGSARR